MFRKIVSRLSFSPALVGQLGFYAQRLKKEQVTRRLGLVFVALALAVQALVVFQAPESANAASDADFVHGGLGLGANRSLNNFLNPYDNNTDNLKDMMNAVGITRDEIAATQFGVFWTTGKISWGRVPQVGQSGVLPVYNAAGQQVSSIYGRDYTYANGHTDVYGYIGQSARVGWFAITQACGNLVTEFVPPPIVPEPPKPAVIELSKSAKNVTQGNVDATKQAAKENDRITYTLTAKNTGGTASPVTFKDHLGDILEYSTIVDLGGGSFNPETKYLSWPDVTITPGAQQSRTYSVKVLSSIPATPTGTSFASSYNCLMENVFGNGVTIPIVCAPPKVIETVVNELPQTGPGENILFAGIVASIVTFFYFRSKQMNKEVRLIRRDLNAGTI